MKKLACLIALLGFTACGDTKNEAYYQQHPKDLMSFLKTCDDTGEKTLCHRLKPLGKQVEQALFELQTEPQAFGSKIIALQIALSKASDAKTRQTIEAELRFKRAMVAWIESPERE